jgi:hypothetical protein
MKNVKIWNKQKKLAIHDYKKTGCYDDMFPYDNLIKPKDCLKKYCRKKFFKYPHLRFDI